MAKYKQVVLSIGLAVVTCVSWVVTSCAQVLDSPVPAQSNPVDNPLPEEKTIIPSETTVSSISVPEPATTITAAFLPPPIELPLPETISTAAPTNYAVDIATFSLTIVGAVSTPLDLSYAQIQAYPPVTQTAEIICPDTEDEFDDWTGVPLSTLLKAAGLTAGAAEVVFTGVDGYHIQLPLETVLNDGVFLAYQMNGKTLTQDRGYPLRLVVIGWLGNYWMRWVTKIEVKSVLSTFNRNPAVIKQLSVSAVAAGIKLCPCKVAGGVSAKNM